MAASGREAYFSGAGYAIVRTSSKSAAGAAIVVSMWRGPSTSICAEARYRIASSGLTHGPPDWLHPGELKIPISMSSSEAVLSAVWSIFHHSSLIIRTLRSV